MLNVKLTALKIITVIHKAIIPPINKPTTPNINKQKEINMLDDNEDFSLLLSILFLHL